MLQLALLFVFGVVIGTTERVIVQGSLLQQHLPPCGGRCGSDPQVFFKLLFQYLDDAIEVEGFREEFFNKLIEVLEEKSERFPHLMEHILEFLRQNPDGDSCFLRRFFGMLFEKLFRRYEDSEDSYLEDGMSVEIDEVRDISPISSSIISTKLFKKLFEQFFKKVKDDITKNGLNEGALLDFVMKLYDFYLQYTTEDESGEKGKLEMNDLLNLLFDLLSMFGDSSRRILKADCLPVEINEEEVKCEKKGSKTKCKIKKKNKIGKDGKEKYSYEEETKVYEGKTWDDLTEKQQQRKEKLWKDVKGPSSKGKVKTEEKNEFEGYLQVETDEGEEAVMKFKVKCKYKSETKEYTDEFVNAMTSITTPTPISSSSSHENKKIDEHEFFTNFFDHMKDASQPRKAPKEDDGKKYIPSTSHQFDLIFNTLVFHLDEVTEGDMLVEEDDDYEQEAPKKNDDSKHGQMNTELGIVELYGADFTVSIIILSCIMLFILLTLLSLMCCTCCFVYYYLREKCDERKRKGKQNAGEDGYRRLEEDAVDQFELEDEEDDD